MSSAFFEEQMKKERAARARMEATQRKAGGAAKESRQERQARLYQTAAVEPIDASDESDGAADAGKRGGARARGSNGHGGARRGGEGAAAEKAKKKHGSKRHGGASFDPFETTNGAAASTIPVPAARTPVSRPSALDHRATVPRYSANRAPSERQPSPVTEWDSDSGDEAGAGGAARLAVPAARPSGRAAAATPLAREAYAAAASIPRPRPAQPGQTRVLGSTTRSQAPAVVAQIGDVGFLDTTSIRLDGGVKKPLRREPNRKQTLPKTLRATGPLDSHDLRKLADHAEIGYMDVKPGRATEFKQGVVAPANRQRGIKSTSPMPGHPGEKKVRYVPAMRNAVVASSKRVNKNTGSPGRYYANGRFVEDGWGED